MSTAVTTKVVALGAVGTLIAQGAVKAASRIRDALPVVTVEWPAMSGAAEVVGDTADLVLGAAADIPAAVAEMPSNWRLAAAAGVGAFACWSGPRVYRMARTLIARKKRWICGGLVAESIYPDSEERQVMEPRCMVRLAFVNAAGEYVMTGWGYRSDYNGEPYVITAQHCLSFDRQMYLRKGDLFFPIDVSDSIPLGNDAALVPVPAKVMSQLGVQKAKLGLLSDRGQAVSALGLSGKGTTGLLEHARRSGYFGWVVYKGTTMAGYSGSAYFSGSTVYGLHTTGGNFNGGLCSMYLHVKAKIATDDRSEDESPSLIDEWYDDPDNDFDVEWDGDYAIVTDGRSGKYIRMSKFSFEQAQTRYETRLERQRDVDQREREAYERGLEQECGNVVVPPSTSPTQVTVSIPVQTGNQSGNSERPGNTRGGGGSAQQPRLEPERPRTQIVESSQRLPKSKTSRKIRMLRQQLQQQKTTSSQTGSGVSTGPSQSTQNGV